MQCSWDEPQGQPAGSAIRVLAYTLTMVFYHGQVRSHCRAAPPRFCETARQIGYRSFVV
jgi:hypothetical protein